MIRIDPAERADLPTILRFIRELAEYEREPDKVKTTLADLDAVHFGKDAHVASLIARVDDEPVGLALYFFNYSTWTGKPGLYLEDLFVHPDARGTGAGLALMRRLATIARERGCARMEWAVLDWNEPAIRFYRRLGAVGQDEWTGYRLELSEMNAIADG